jgi:hypothetical protein
MATKKMKAPARAITPPSYFLRDAGALGKGLATIVETSPTEVADFAVERSNRAEGLTCNSKY